MPVATAAGKPATPTVDWVEHAEGLTALTPRIGAARTWLVRLHELLVVTPPDAPWRANLEARWERVANAADGVLRDAYRHMALLATGDAPTAWAAWDWAVGSREEWHAAGLDRLRSHWAGREGAAVGYTHDDLRVLANARIPAAFDPSLLVVERGAS